MPAACRRESHAVLLRKIVRRLQDARRLPQRREGFLRGILQLQLFQSLAMQCGCAFYFWLSARWCMLFIRLVSCGLRRRSFIVIGDRHSQKFV